MAVTHLAVIETLDAGTASSNSKELKVKGPMVIQAYSADWDGGNVTVQVSIDGVAWSTKSTTLADGATVNSVELSATYGWIKLTCAGTGTEGKALLVKALVYA